MRRYELLEQLEKALRIDRDNLDDVVDQQPSLFHEVASEHELLLSRRDAAKQNIKTTEAEVYLELKRRSRKGDSKVTEVELGHMVAADNRVKKANELHLRLSEEAGQWHALKQAFEHRKDAIREMVRLFLSNYYSEIEDNSTKVRRTFADEAKEAVARERRRRVQ